MQIEAKLERMAAQEEVQVAQVGVGHFHPVLKPSAKFREVLVTLLGLVDYDDIACLIDYLATDEFKSMTPEAWRIVSAVHGQKGN